MTKFFLGMLVAGLVVGMALTGCGKKVTSSQEAIQVAETLKEAEDKINYLVDQAEYFLHTKNYQEASKTAQYVLRKLDAKNEEAQNVVTSAQEEIGKAADEAAALKKKMATK